MQLFTMFEIVQPGCDDDMRLSRLIADFNLVEARLTQSVIRDVSVQIRVALTRRTASLMDSIERHDPEDTKDMRTKIEFFLHRAQRGRNRHDMSIALDLIARHDSASSSRSPPCQSRSTHPHEVLDRLAGRGAEADDLAAHIKPMTQRASLVDHEFRHICTSRGNLEFHAMPSERFQGLHMADLIGAQRYYDRSRAHLAGALSGRSRAYYYALDVPTLGPRVMQCAMRPWLAPGGEVSGVVMWVNDVTNRLGQGHGFGDVPFALPDGGPDHRPDHNIDGTT